MYLLGYLASQSKVYLMDKEFSVVPYTLLLSVVVSAALERKTMVLAVVLCHLWWWWWRRLDSLVVPYALSRAVVPSHCSPHT